jgi:hypothetical protein
VLILPLIDLLILVGTAFLAIGFIFKTFYITTVYRPTLLGFTAVDFVLLAGVCWGFALTLAARTWVKLNEPKVLALRREQMQAEGRRQAQEFDQNHLMVENAGEPAAVQTEVEAAGADRG